jgi:hypothetical protein
LNIPIATRQKAAYVLLTKAYFHIAKNWSRWDEDAETILLDARHELMKGMEPKDYIEALNLRKLLASGDGWEIEETEQEEAAA